MKIVFFSIENLFTILKTYLHRLLFRSCQNIKYPAKFWNSCPKTKFKQNYMFKRKTDFNVNIN